jgi:hypothetical protein
MKPSGAGAPIHCLLSLLFEGGRARPRRRATAAGRRHIQVTFMLSSVAMPQCGMLRADLGRRSAVHRPARRGRHIRAGSGACSPCASGSQLASGPPAARRKTPARRAAGPPTAPAISRRTTDRAARSSCSAASKVASAAGIRRVAARAYRLTPRGRSGSAARRCRAAKCGLISQRFSGRRSHPGGRARP